MSICCQKCGAGAGSLEARTEHLGNGVVLQVVTCLICRWRIEREVLTAPVNLGRVAIQARELTDAQREELRERNRTTAEKYRRPCKVHGCEGHYHATRNPIGLCTEHNKRLYSWTNRRCNRVPPPVALVNGHWIERGVPLPGIPGEKPAPAWDAAEPGAKPRPERARAQRGGQKPCPVQPAPGLEAGLFKLARRGHAASRALLVALEAS
jgi:hypothetical protein